MRITSQQNDNTLARNWRGPYSRVLRGPHLSDALGLLVQRLARNSGLNHHHGQGGSFVARRCVLCFPFCTPERSPVQPSGAGAPPFSTEFTASTKKEKRSKKERNVRKGRPDETAAAEEIEIGCLRRHRLMIFTSCLDKSSQKTCSTYPQFQQARRRLTLTTINC
jgi:hypothetical protein